MTTMPKKRGVAILPKGSNPAPLKFPHFPTRHQIVIWRNWEMAPVQRLAQVLKTTTANVIHAAEDLGLRVPPEVDKKWLERGYLTIIRNNWHLLPYEQLLQLLGWTPEKLAYALKEDDFLWHKLGNLKPNAKPVYYRPLTAAETARTREMRQIIDRHFPPVSLKSREKPFAFLNQFGHKQKQNAGKERFNNFDLRLIYSYAAVYGDPLLEPKLNPYPADLLARYRELGVNGVWLPGILYTLIPWDAAPALSGGFEKRLKNLRILTERAAKFGIGVYLYLNEPRPMPLTFFKRYPEWKGVEYPQSCYANCCTSQAPVQAYLEQATTRLFTEAPELAGVFTITMSENPTNCYSKNQAAKCPRCSRRRAAEVIAEVNNTIERGVHRAKPRARVIAWNWAWGLDWEHAALDLLSDKIELMCTSEWGLPTRIGGVKYSVVDYSISQAGPSARAQKMWAHSKKRGMKTVAKVQINNTWECSAVPYIPTPDLVEKHLRNLKDDGVNGLMLSWTLGGYPGGNLELFRKTPGQIAASFGPRAAPHVRQAHKRMSKAFTEFPLACGALYNAPQNYGPANVLHARPTGYHATMLGYPYDDLKSWRSIYPANIFESQLKKLSVGWQKGLKQLELALKQAGMRSRFKLQELFLIAAAIYCHFKSAYLQVAFVRRRASGASAKLSAIIREEQELAKTLHTVLLNDSRIGFEASNHYYYTANSLKEKVLNCEYLLKIYLDK